MPPRTPSVDNDDDVELARPLVAGSGDDGDDHQNEMDTAVVVVGKKAEIVDDEVRKEPKKWSLRSAPGAIKALSSCALYSFCSVSMILTNKSLASSYNHLMRKGDDLNILLVVFQAVAAVVCVESCRYLKFIESYPPLTWKAVKAWAPVNIFFCLMLFTGMASLQTNSVPMVTVFKNVSNICTAVGDYFFFGSRSEGLVIVAFALMLGGAVLAAWNDIDATPLGIFWMAANCLSCSAYVLYMKFATNTFKTSKFGMVYVNNVLCVAFLLPAAMMMGEVRLFQETKALHTADYAFKNAFAGFVGFFLNFAALHCVATTGPSTFAIVGSLNKIPVAFLGYLIFDSVISHEAWFFIVVSMCGGFLYSYAKLRTSQRDAATRSEAK